MSYELEIFPRKYRYFFSAPHNWMRLCTPFNMHPTKPFDRKSGDGQFDGLDRYQDLLTSHFKTMDRSLWDNLIKFHWLWRKFGYRWESYEKGDGSKKLNEIG